jgi:hypothetical protein
MKPAKLDSMPLHALACLLALGAAVLAACAPSEEEIQREFDDVVAGANACETADECVLVYPDCPLGCFVAVNAANADEVDAKAD